MEFSGSMDLLNEKKVHYSAEACANCGEFCLPAKTHSSAGGMKLCQSCLEERRSSLDDLRADVRRQFNLSRSPDLRSCFLRLLCSGDIDLEPGGWRTGMALGLELKDAGYSIHESRQILLRARANHRPADGIVDRLLNSIYRMKDNRPLTCEQIRGLNVICDQCPCQYETIRGEQKTEVC